MIKIAVCDDNPYELEEVAEKIKIYLDQQETALQTVPFHRDAASISCNTTSSL